MGKSHTSTLLYFLCPGYCLANTVRAQFEIFWQRPHSQPKYLVLFGQFCITRLVLYCITWSVMGYVLHSYLCAVFYTLPWKIQPIRVQESNWILNGITSNIPIMPLYFLWQLAQNSYSTLSHGILVNLLLTRGEGWGILAQGCDSMD